MEDNFPEDSLHHNSTGPTFRFSGPFKGLCAYVAARKPLAMHGQFDLDINGAFGFDSANALTGSMSLATRRY